jgi:hypothetical protein
VEGVSWDLFEEYFAQLDVDKRPDAWAYINPDAMFNFLEDPRNTTASAVILEDFKRINDICSGGMNLVVRAYRVYDIPFNQNEPDLALSMRLFLHYRDAFSYAWSRYLFHSSTSKVTLYSLGIPPIDITQLSVDSFQAQLAEWFQRLGKGERCEVDFTEDDNEVMFLISHGSYLRTVAHWQEESVEIMSYRPASEDVLIYDKQRSTLTVKASIEKDQAEYLRAFATCIASDIGLVDKANDSKLRFPRWL